MRTSLLAISTALVMAVPGGLYAQGSKPPGEYEKLTPRPDPTPPSATESVAPADSSPVVTLRRALARTYVSNPTIMAQRAQVRALDEDVALSRAQGRPQITTTAGFNQDVYRINAAGDNGRNFSAGAEVGLPLFAGGQIRNSVKAADTRVEAGREDLRATEGDIFTEAVTVYMDVLRDRAIVGLNADQVRVLETHLEAAQIRFRVGDLTQTDVSQSEARLALARSALATSAGRLRGTEENFRRVIGIAAGDLQPPPPLPDLPDTPEQAVDLALAENADIAAISLRTRAAGFDAAVARGARLPTISAVSNTRYTNALGTADRAAGVPAGFQANTSTDVGAGLSLRLPLYQGGAGSARVRQAEEVRTGLLEQAVAVERLAVANALAAFASYNGALSAIAANEVAVAANELALASVRTEQTVGTRSVLDVLNSEQELLNSRISLTAARRDAYVAGFQLLNTTGAAEAEDLSLDVGPLYDPQVHYRRYSRSWSDWNDGGRRRSESTRTVSETSNSPVTSLREGRTPREVGPVIDTDGR